MRTLVQKCEQAQAQQCVGEVAGREVGAQLACGLCLLQQFAHAGTKLIAQRLTGWQQQAIADETVAGNQQSEPLHQAGEGSHRPGCALAHGNQQRMDSGRGVFFHRARSRPSRFPK